MGDPTGSSSIAMSSTPPKIPLFIIMFAPNDVFLIEIAIIYLRIWMDMAYYYCIYCRLPRTSKKLSFFVRGRL